MHKLLLAILIAAAPLAQIAMAQSADERLGYATRGSHAREALASAQRTSTQANSVGEIYPNPAAGEASISLNLNAAGKVTFYNLLGTPVASQDFGKDTRTLTIDFAQFPEGVYFGIISAGNKTVATRRVSVKR